jgi:DNA-binding transcriptional LysR family regulator
MMSILSFVTGQSLRHSIVASIAVSLQHHQPEYDDRMDTLTSMRCLIAVAELRSFTAAAARLDISTQMVSKHIMHLERRMALRLLNRTSRSVSLTEAGELYLARVSGALAEIDEAETLLGHAVAPSGILRLSAPVWMANAVFARALADYQRSHPQVQLDIDLSGRMVNLVEERYDLALRATVDPDPSLFARKLADITFRLVASPSYLAATSTPAKLADLSGRDLLAFIDVPFSGAMTWPKLKASLTLKFKVVMRSANETLLREAALAGMGLVFLPDVLIDDELRSGALVPVLPQEAVIVVPLYAIYSSRKYLSAKVRTFIDHIALSDVLRLKTPR